MKQKNLSLFSLKSMQDFKKFNKLIHNDPEIHESIRSIVFNNYLFDYKFREAFNLALKLYRKMTCVEVSEFRL